jgi:hypothetical protein
MMGRFFIALMAPLVLSSLVIGGDEPAKKDQTAAGSPSQAELSAPTPSLAARTARRGRRNIRFPPRRSCLKETCGFLRPASNMATKT